jgi:hypothetical protein
LAAVDRDQLMAAAARHGVEAWVYTVAAAVPAGTPESAPASELASRLEPAMARSRLVRTQAHADLSIAAAALDGTSIPWLTFKGPVLDEAIHQPPGLRAYGDLDLLVPARSFEGAVDALERAGAVVLDRNWTLFRRCPPEEIHLQLPYGSVVDLHWHFLGTISDRRRFGIDVAGMLHRRRWVQIAGLQVPTMDVADTLIHVALHAASHGGNRLLWLKDIEQCVVHDAPDWDLVTLRCQEWDVGLAVSTMLARTGHILDLAVPDWVLRALGFRPPWSALARSLDRLTPTHRSYGGRSLAGMIAAAAGSNQWESLGPLARRTARAARHPWNMPPPGPSRDPADPFSPLHPSGGLADRTGYLAAVARES